MHELFYRNQFRQVSLKRAFLMALSVYPRTKYVWKSTDRWKYCHFSPSWLSQQSIWLLGNRVAQVCSRINHRIGLDVKTVEQKVNDHIVPGGFIFTSN